MMQDGILPIPITLPFKRPGGGLPFQIHIMLCHREQLRLYGQPLQL